MGRRFVLDEEEEKVLVKILETLAEWGFPVESKELRVIVRDYLNAIPRKVEMFGPDNMPGEDWCRYFIARHKTLSTKYAENIKRSRAEVSRKALETYFKELRVSLDNVPLSNLVNYDETAFVDDPKQRKVSDRHRYLSAYKSIIFSYLVYCFPSL